MATTTAAATTTVTTYLVVCCEDAASGTPVLFRCAIIARPGQVEDLHHLDAAEDLAIREGYHVNEYTQVVIEDDGLPSSPNAWAFLPGVAGWGSVPAADISESVRHPVYSRTAPADRPASAEAATDAADAAALGGWIDDDIDVAKTAEAATANPLPVKRVSLLVRAGFLLWRLYSK